MTEPLLIRNVRPMGGVPVDLLVRDGGIQQISATINQGSDPIRILEGDGQLVLPGFVNAHAHIDKNLLGLGWHTNRLPGTRIRDFVDYERRVRRELNLSARKQSALEVEAAVAAGTTHIRTHVDIDTDAGLTHLEGVMATRDEFKDAVTMQLVAFPQSGMLVRPGTAELLEEAVKMGAECIGGLDPSTVDRDPVRHLDTIFDIADRHGAEVDIHLHEPGRLGGFAIELIAERTRVLGMKGRVTISHAFCLGMIDSAHLDPLIELLRENSITIMSLGSGLSPFPPIKRLFEAGVALCTGTDGVHDTWGACNSVDMLERLKLLGYRCGFRKDEEREMLLQIATFGGAQLVGDRTYGLEQGCRADLVILPGQTISEAIVRQPPRTYVLKNGRLIAAGGEFMPV